MKSLSNYKFSEFNLLLALAIVLTIVLTIGCGRHHPQPDLQEYVTYANRYVASMYGGSYSSSFLHRVDSLGLQTLDPADSNWSHVQGAELLGGFHMYQMPTYCGLFSVDVVGDTVSERMLCIAHNFMGTYSDFVFAFFGEEGPSVPPFATYRISANDLRKIEFKQLCGTQHPELLLYYDHFPSIYLNAGLDIVQIQEDTAYSIGNIGTMFYDWKDHGKYEEAGQALADGEAYRELSTLEFEDENQDGCLEIKLHTQKAIVTQDWERAIDSLDILHVLDSDSSHWRYSSQHNSYEVARGVPYLRNPDFGGHSNWSRLK